MRRRILEIVRKEFRQVLREPRTRALLFMPPLIQLLVFGFAVNLDVENARLAWMDQDHTEESRDLLAGFVGSRRFEVSATPATDDQVRKLMDKGQVDLEVRVLPGFARDIKRGRTTTVQVLIDGTNSNTASIVSSYASQIIANYSGKVLHQQNADRL